MSNLRKVLIAERLTDTPFALLPDARNRPGLTEDRKSRAMNKGLYP